MINKVISLNRIIVPELAKLSASKELCADTKECFVSLAGLNAILWNKGILAGEQLLRPVENGPDSLITEKSYKAYAIRFNDKYPLFSFLLDLIVDGTEPEQVQLMGEAHVLKTEDKKARYVKLMILDGILWIQAGYSTKRLKEMLLSMMPDDIHEDAISDLNRIMPLDDEVKLI